MEVLGPVISGTNVHLLSKLMTKVPVKVRNRVHLENPMCVSVSVRVCVSLLGCRSYVVYIKREGGKLKATKRFLHKSPHNCLHIFHVITPVLIAVHRAEKLFNPAACSVCLWRNSSGRENRNLQKRLKRIRYGYRR